MKLYLTVFLLASLLAGCSSATSLENSAPATPLMGKPGSANPNQAAPIEPAPTRAAPLETGVNNTTAAPDPMLIKVGPPRTPITSASTPLAGWQTFTSASLGVAVDYPADWLVIETGAGVKFSSSQGQLILLQVDQNSASTATTGQDCVKLINSYSLAGDICSDATVSAYRAVFKKSADESKPELTLSTISTEKPTVFLQMVNSFRFTP